MSRGQPVDRYYVDRFLSRHAADIRGRVLEIGDDGYTRRFGTVDVVQSDVLDVDASNQGATMIADLCNAPGLPSDQFDCVIITQVLVLTRDPVAALRTLNRICKPGGVILCTCGAISRVSVHEGERENWRWSVYVPTAQLLFEEAGFVPESLIIESWGNLRVATAFLWGLAQEDIKEEDFLPNDPGFPLITSIRATKPLSPVT